jgi:APA family basic amino acid/polyamine antiporter
VVLVGVGFFSPAGDWSRFVPFFERHPGSPARVPAIAGAIVSGFFSFGGWWQASNLAGEVEDAPRNLPRALTGGVVAVAMIYVAVSAVFFLLVPLAEVTSGQTFAAQAGQALFGSAGGAVLSAIVLLCVLGSLFAFMTTAPRVYYAMARDGAAPAWAGAVGARSGAPLGAVLVQASLASLLVGIGTFDEIVAFFVFVTVVFLGLIVVGLVRLRRRAGESAGASAWLFLGCIGVVLATIAAGQPRESALGLAVVALGWPAYRFLVRPEAAHA